MSHDLLGNPSNLFAQSLARHAPAVEAALARRLNALEPPTPARLIAAMRHAVLGGGKRVRPVLLIESAAVFGVPAEAAVDAAAAVECLHAYSLVHDDLPSMDDDDLRRGRPTVHKAFDEWTAILAGDALQALAFDILADARTHPDAAVRSELVAGLARAAGAAGMVGGQCLDLEASKLGAPPAPTAEHVRRLQAMKTGALIAFSCEAGAILGRAGPAARSAVAAFGRHLGEAFQIADDLLDATGDAATLGKASQKDAAAGKATLISLVGVEAAQARLQKLEVEAATALRAFGPTADVLGAAARFVAARQR